MAGWDLGTLKLPVRQVTKDAFMTVELTGLRVFRIRLWLAGLVIRLGVFISGMGCNIEFNDESR